MVEIVQNSAAEQKCFLGHKADFFPQHLFGHPQDIHPVDADGAALNIVETGNQVGDGGFSGAGAADDGGGFADVCRKADIVQHRFLRTFILEGNVAKFQLGFRKVLPGLARCHIRIGVDSQHLVDTVGAGLCSWEDHKDHNSHNEVHQNHDGILCQRHDVSNFHSAIGNPLAAACQDENSANVHDDHNNRHHHGENLVDADSALCIVHKGLIGALLLKFGTVKSTDHPDTCQHFPQGTVDLIQQGLQLGKQRHHFFVRKREKIQTTSMATTMVIAREGLLEKAKKSPAMVMMGAGRIISVPAI